MTERVGWKLAAGTASLRETDRNLSLLSPGANLQYNPQAKEQTFEEQVPAAITGTLRQPGSGGLVSMTVSPSTFKRISWWMPGTFLRIRPLKQTALSTVLRK